MLSDNFIYWAALFVFMYARRCLKVIKRECQTSFGLHMVIDVQILVKA